LQSDSAGARAPLLGRRLLIISGKGGTGKTTVAASLARAAAAQGLRVLVAEVGREAQVPRLLDPRAPSVGYEEREVTPGVWVMRIDPFAALAEYLGLQLPIPALVERVVRNKAFRQLMEASPGWRELITLGKVWHLEQMQQDGAPKYDLIVVDAPATGHGVTLLDVPRVVVSTVRAGPLRHQTERVEALLADPERTLLVPVAQAEELPCRETATLVQRVREQLSAHVDRIVVNGVHAAPFPAGLGDLPERLERLEGSVHFERLPTPTVLARCARHVRERHALNQHYLGEIERMTHLPLVTLPYLAEGVNGPDDLAQLAEAVIAEPRAEAA
jgi:anion-transporting  ArsA/GET3 family ATPase